MTHYHLPAKTAAYLNPNLERVLRALGPHRTRTVADVTAVVAGDPLTHQQVAACLSQLRITGWVEGVQEDGGGRRGRWRMRPAVRAAYHPRGALPRRPRDVLGRACLDAAPTAPELTPPPRHYKLGTPTLVPAAWEPARAGALDHARVPSLQLGRSVPYWGGK